MLSAKSDGRGQEVRTADWSSSGPHNWMGCQAITSRKQRSTRMDTSRSSSSEALCVSCSPNFRICRPQNEDKLRMWVETKKHVEFTCEIHAEQARCHRWFVHEHLAEVTSWNLEAVSQILAQGEVEAVIADQCRYSLLTWSKNGKAMPARKRTKFMTDCLEISAELQFRCDVSLEHQRPLGGRAKHAQRYELSALATAAHVSGGFLGKGR